MTQKMKAAVFVEPNRIVLEEKPIPGIGALDALLLFASQRDAS